MQDTMAKLVFTRKAAEDLEGIWKYTFDTWSREQADKYYNSILAYCETVARRPEYLGRHYEDVKSTLRGYPSGKHIIFFRRLQDGRVRIVRILHERMDLKRHLL